MGTVLSIGPSPELVQADKAFILSKPEFVTVQTYVEAGKRLPNSRDAFQMQVGVSKDDVAQFDALIAAYASVVTHTSYFSDTVFPMSVQLASDVVNYNLKVPIYYGALTSIIDAWNNGTSTPDEAQKKLVAILDNLKTTASGYAADAKTVKDKMIGFAEETKSDQNTLRVVGQDIRNKYASQEVIKTYLDQIDNDAREIKFWNDQYSHDVTVAATTPTYAWVPFVGLIAAAIVAGIYGKKASDDLDRVHEFQDKLAKAQGDLRTAVQLNADLTMASDSLSGILDKLNQALPVLEKMEGIWGAIADDLAGIVTAITQDIEQAPSIIKDLGVAEAISAWAKVAAIADVYRANAYITVKSEEEIKEHPDQYAVAQNVA